MELSFGINPVRNSGSCSEFELCAGVQLCGACVLTPSSKVRHDHSSSRYGVVLIDFACACILNVLVVKCDPWNTLLKFQVRHLSCSRIFRV